MGPLWLCIFIAWASATGEIPGTASCDSRIVIAVDISGSMSTTLVGENKAALLRGQLMQSIEHDLASRTGLCTALVQFATEARLLVNYTDNVQYVVDAIGAMQFELAHPEYYTNWEAALVTMLALQPNVGYLITDGAPSTRIGCNAQPCDDYAANVAAAKLASEALFAKGVRVVAIGVGKQIGNEALAAVSGPCLGALGCQLDQDYLHIYLNGSQPSAKLGLQLGGHNAQQAEPDTTTTESEETTTAAAESDTTTTALADNTTTEPVTIADTTTESTTTTTATTADTTTNEETTTTATTTEETTTTTTTTTAPATTTTTPAPLATTSEDTTTTTTTQPTTTSEDTTTTTTTQPITTEEVPLTELQTTTPLADAVPVTDLPSVETTRTKGPSHDGTSRPVMDGTKGTSRPADGTKGTSPPKSTPRPRPKPGGGGYHRPGHGSPPQRASVERRVYTDVRTVDNDNWIAIVVLSVVLGVFVFIVLTYVCCYASKAPYGDATTTGNDIETPNVQNVFKQARLATKEAKFRVATAPADKKK